jgi:hypothetical protein
MDIMLIVAIAAIGVALLLAVGLVKAKFGKSKSAN